MFKMLLLLFIFIYIITIEGKTENTVEKYVPQTKSISQYNYGLLCFISQSLYFLAVVCVASCTILYCIALTKTTFYVTSIFHCTNILCQNFCIAIIS